jgi:hypothetical protein
MQVTCQITSFPRPRRNAASNSPVVAVGRDSLPFNPETLVEEIGQPLLLLLIC